MQSLMYRYDLFWVPSPSISSSLGFAFSFWMKSWMTPCWLLGPTMLARRMIMALKL